MDSKLSALFISILLAAGCLAIMVSCNRSPKNDDEYIARNLLEHTIVNENLREELIRFNNRFKNDRHAQGRGLQISLQEVYPDSLVYSIGYAAGLNNESPVLICEPIDGKPVTLSLPFLYYGFKFYNEFKLPKRKALELVKYSCMEEYEMHKSYIDDFEIVNGDTVRTDMTVLFDFVSLSLVYDRDHNLIRRDTLGWYKK